jgi:hypothetical protein
MTRWSATTRTPPQLLRARLRLALHSRGGKNLNPVVHHAAGRYSATRLKQTRDVGPSAGLAATPTSQAGAG